MSSEPWSFETWVAITSAIAAVSSVAFSGWSAFQSKRQADAVFGDVPASFGLYQEPAKEISSLSDATFEIVNHNRQALLLHSLSMEFPDGIEVMQAHESTVSLIRDIISQLRNKQSAYTFDIPHRIRGCGANSEPHLFTIPFKCRWIDYEKKKFPFSLYFKCEYSYEGKPDRHFGYPGVRIIPPDHGLD